MDIGWLQDFLTVAELGNFTRASQQRNASQPALTRRIQALEAWLGARLIDRSVFPTQLTPEGERFRELAGEILRQVVDARIAVSGQINAQHDRVRVAVPHSLATGRLPQWWRDWASGRALSCQVVAGNVHDTVAAFVSGAADLLVCYHHAHQPIHLDPEQYESVPVAVEYLRPYALAEKAERWALPEKGEREIPLLKYSSGSYLGRMVDLIFENAPATLTGTCAFESDMADVLCHMASAGHGVAWLLDCTARQAGTELVPVGGGGKWSMPLSLAAYRDRANHRAALNRLWAGLLSDQQEKACV
ncbi:putative LysR family transcriptional regulator [uncultured Alphaproteobacteria bacterium]|uniref:Putative LysR family transcriptional regulator n=1 Tax=uncultured Alphaproteobacteria bacterium TaxID=91750 RepID=A0A212KLL5_9PROT|nr:putative LysR family transcriptional regulator [uncultured Alphaproteobacteria bacterium]